MKDYPIYLTGKWRDRSVSSTDVTRLESLIREKGFSGSFLVLKQEDEAIFMARTMFNLMKDVHVDVAKNYLFIEGGSGSCQYVVMSGHGLVSDVFMSDGFPRSGWRETQDAKIKAMDTIRSKYGDTIETICMIGSLFYVLKRNQHVIKDMSTFPTEITSTGSDFDIYVTKHYPTVRTLCFRNVTVDGVVRKVTWGSGVGSYFVDLGSAKAALTDPSTGVQISNVDLEDSIEDIADQLEEILIDDPWYTTIWKYFFG